MYTPLTAFSPWTKLGEKSSAPAPVMIGTPDEDLILQFLPKRLERPVERVEDTWAVAAEFNWERLRSFGALPFVLLSKDELCEAMEPSGSTG